MLLKVFAIYDTGVSTWLSPIFSRTLGDVTRQLSQAVADPNHKFGMYPADYNLFQIGTWDDDKCFFDLLKAPLAISCLIEYKKNSENPGVLLDGSGRVPTQPGKPDPY